MINEIVKGFEYNGEFLDKNDLWDLINFRGGKFEDINELKDYFNDDDLNDFINELSDSKVDIYNYDLRKWAVDNYAYIEIAVDEFGIDQKSFDFHKLIMSGQYYAFSEEFNNLKYEFLNYLDNYKFMIYGWMGKNAIYPIEFDTFEDGWAFIYENVENVDHAYDDLFVELKRG
mgnify:CR=1 FL=1